MAYAALYRTYGLVNKDFIEHSMFAQHTNECYNRISGRFIPMDRILTGADRLEGEKEEHTSSGDQEERTAPNFITIQSA